MKDDLDKLSDFISDIIYKYADALDIDSLPDPESSDKYPLNSLIIKNIAIEPHENKWYNNHEIIVQTINKIMRSTLWEKKK